MQPQTFQTATLSSQTNQDYPGTVTVQCSSPWTEIEAPKDASDIVRKVESLLMKGCGEFSTDDLIHVWQELHREIPVWLAHQLLKKPWQVRSLVDQLKHSKLDWAGAEEWAQVWWQKMENMNGGDLPMLLRLSMELATRNATILDFVRAVKESKAQSLLEALHYLDYQRQRAKSEASGARENRGPESAPI